MSIESELLAIQKANPQNLLIVEEVHEWAEEHPPSALFKSLEWDNKEAGYQYRLIQIGRLVRVHLVHGDNEPRVISLSSDRVKPKGGYRAMDDVLADKDLFQVALDDAFAEFERVQRRYENLKQLEPIWDVIKEVRAKHGRRKGRGKRGEDRATA